MAGIKYRELGGYKYMLMEDYHIQTAVLCKSIQTEFFGITSTGLLTIRKGYCWNGPNKPAIPTKNFLRGSLVHDALYQLMALGKIDQSYRAYADNLLERICKEDGMSSFRAKYVRLAVRWFGGPNAEVSDEPEVEILTAP